MVLIFIISSFEVSLPQVEHFPWRDKGVHVVEYAVLGWLCTRAACGTWPSRATWRIGAFAFFVAALWGLTDEIHQAFVPGRVSELWDWAADCIGSGLGTVGALAWTRAPRAVSPKPQ